MSMGVDDVGRAFTAQHEYLKLHCWQKEHRQSIQTEQIEIKDNALKKTCFNCEYNLSWANKNGLANCGLQRPNIPKRPTPDYAISCPMFKRKR